MARYFKILLPILILLSGAGLAWQIFANGPKVERQPVEILPPSVKVLDVFAQNVKIPVITQGTVRPRTAIHLAAEVTGRIVNVSPNFANGGFFRKNDVLVSIDPNDYRLAITKAEALVARAKQQLSKAEVDFQQAQQEIRDMGKSAASVSAYALKQPQLEEARANFKAAQADLEIAKIQLKRCKIRAPFDGRVLEKSADVGQYVTPGNTLAELYAVDIAEVRLPISEIQAALLDIPHGYQQNHQDEPEPGPNVSLHGHYAGKPYTWPGNIVRTEGGIDERNRLLYVVAQVLQPYGKDTAQPDRPPLAMGMFIEAEIEGRLFIDTFVLPRAALHGNDTLWILDKESRLELRKVRVLFRGQQQVYIKQGLESGEQVILSPLDAVVSGMLLRQLKSELDLGAES